jgi:phage terminase large subunit GpA-like protein
MQNQKALADLWRYTMALFLPPKKQTVSEWADENRILSTDYSAEPGRWKTDRAPYQREIMDSFTQPGIWEIVIMASAQVGKS